MSTTTKAVRHYFPNKASAEAFRTKAKRCRIQGRVVLRKTLDTKAVGKHFERDLAHADGYVVSVRAFAFADEIELAQFARDCGRITAPHTH